MNECSNVRRDGCSMRGGARRRAREPRGLRRDHCVTSRRRYITPTLYTRARSLAQADGLLHGLDSILWIGRRGDFEGERERGGWDGAGRIGSDEFVVHVHRRLNLSSSRGERGSPRAGGNGGRGATVVQVRRAHLVEGKGEDLREESEVAGERVLELRGERGEDDGGVEGALDRSHVLGHRPLEVGG